MDTNSTTKSLVRAMEILRVVAATPDGISPAQVAAEIDVPRPTVYRLLATLESVGMAERDGDGRWTAGYEMVRLGQTVGATRSLATRTHPALEWLVQQTGETAMVAVVRGVCDVEVISQIDAPNLLGVAAWVGRPVDPHASVGGKLLLADLDEPERGQQIAVLPLRRWTDATITDPEQFEAELQHVRAQGYAETIDELEAGLSGIGAAIRHPSGAIIAVLGIYGPTARLCGERHDEFVGAVTEAAERAAAAL